MKIQVVAGPLAEVRADALVVPVGEGGLEALADLAHSRSAPPSAIGSAAGSTAR